MFTVRKKKCIALFVEGHRNMLVLSNGSVPLTLSVTFVMELYLSSIVKGHFQKIWSKESIIWYKSDK